MRSPSGIDRVLEAGVERGDVPGVVAMAADRGSVVYEGAFGRRALPDGAAMTADSVFWIASMTKAITSTAAMQLVEQGRLALDRPIAEILPELSAPQVLEGFDAAGEPRLRPVRRPITLRYLLTHTSGFVYDIFNPELGRYMEQRGIPNIISCQNKALDLPLVFDPGDRWDYGTGIDWAGKAVERISGQRLGDYLAEHIFAPLGMNDTGFKLSPERRARLVGMHTRGDDGTVTPIEFEIPQEPEFDMGGGGLYGTAADYLAFQRVFLNDGRPLLRPDTAAMMARNAIGALDVPPLKTAIPAYSQDADFFPGMIKKWSLGFMISTAAVPGGRGAGSLDLGRARQHVFLDRSGQPDRRGHPDAADPVRRPESSRPGPRFRDGALRGAGVTCPCCGKLVERRAARMQSRRGRGLNVAREEEIGETIQADVGGRASRSAARALGASGAREIPGTGAAYGQIARRRRRADDRGAAAAWRPISSICAPGGRPGHGSPSASRSPTRPAPAARSSASASRTRTGSTPRSCSRRWSRGRYSGATSRMTRSTRPSSAATTTGSARNTAPSRPIA